MKLIVGLGNPGAKYEYTRHNIGFSTIDYLINELAKDFRVNHISKFNAIITEINIEDEKILFVKPLTYMNLSGEAVKDVINWYKIKIEDMVVIYDDLDLPLGKVRFREKGSSGGHNGITSIILSLNSDEFKRVKIGIGRPESKDVINHVLTRFLSDEKEAVNQSIDIATKALVDWVNGIDYRKIMTLYN